METKIVFENEKVKKKYDLLRGRKEMKWLLDSLDNAFAIIVRKPSSGTPIEKYRIPKDLKRRGFDNIWKYNLASGWRLIYSVQGSKIKMLAIILEWLDHKKYQRKYSGKIL